MATFAPEIVEKIKEVTGKTYAQQAQFYLNAFFNDVTQPAEKEAEEIWKLCIDFEKEDFAKGKNGSELNAVQAFNLLQKRDQTKTALELKKMLREVDLDSNGEMALFEYVIHFYKRCPKDAVTRPQGDVNPIELKAMEDKLAALNQQFEELTAQLEAEKIALAKAEQAEKDAIEQEAAAKAAEQVALDEEAKAKAAEAVALDEEAKAKAAEQVALDEEAKAKAAEQVALDEEAKAKAAEAEAIDLEAKANAATKILADAEAELRAVEDEANAIAEEIRQQEQAKIDEMARLDALTQDQTVGIVKRNMAVQQLAQLKGEDSLPLQKAKLTQEAVVRKLKKATDAAAEKTAVAKVASDAATESRNAATAAANQAAAKRAEAVAARELAEAKRAEAVAARELAEAKRAEAVAARELAEQRRAEAVASREAAEQKRAEAVAAKQAAEEAKKATEAAVAQCEKDLAEVTKEFELMKANSGIPLGFEWWTARTLEDKKRSLPQRMW